MRTFTKTLIAAASAAVIAPSAASADTGEFITPVTANGNPAIKVAAELTVTHADGTKDAPKYRVVLANGRLMLPGNAGDTVHIHMTGQDANADNTALETQYCTAGFVAPRAADTDVVLGQGAAPQSLTLPRTVTELTDPGTSADEQHFIDLVNAERAKIGAGPVASQPNYAAAADGGATANDIADGCWAHQGRNGESSSARSVEMGVSDFNNSSLEVFASMSAGNDAAHAVEQFRASPGHWGTLMNPAIKYIGAAQVGTFFVAITAVEANVNGSIPSLPRTSPSKNPAPTTQPQQTTTVKSTTTPQQTTASTPVAKKSLLVFAGKPKMIRGMVRISGRVAGGKAGVFITVEVTGGRKALTFKTITRTGGTFVATRPYGLKAGNKIAAAKKVRATITIPATATTKAASKTVTA